MGQDAGGGAHVSAGGAGAGIGGAAQPPGAGAGRAAGAAGGGPGLSRGAAREARRRGGAGSLGARGDAPARAGRSGTRSPRCEAGYGPGCDAKRKPAWEQKRNAGRASGGGARRAAGPAAADAARGRAGARATRSGAVRADPAATAGEFGRGRVRLALRVAAAAKTTRACLGERAPDGCGPSACSRHGCDQNGCGPGGVEREVWRGPDGKRRTGDASALARGRGTFTVPPWPGLSRPGLSCPVLAWPSPIRLAGVRFGREPGGTGRNIMLNLDTVFLHLPGSTRGSVRHGRRRVGRWRSARTGRNARPRNGARESLRARQQRTRTRDAPPRSRSIGRRRIPRCGGRG